MQLVVIHQGGVVVGPGILAVVDVLGVGFGVVVGVRVRGEVVRVVVVLFVAVLHPLAGRLVVGLAWGTLLQGLPVLLLGLLFLFVAGLFVLADLHWVVEFEILVVIDALLRGLEVGGWRLEVLEDCLRERLV